MGSYAVSRKVPRATALERVYAILCDAADKGEVCPSNDAIGVMMGHQQGGIASDLIGELVDTGRIKRERHRGARIITIPATGKSTAIPVFKRDARPTQEYKRKRPVREIVQLAADIFKVPTKDLVSDSKFHCHTKPRFAVYTVAVEQGWSTCHVGRILGRDHSSVIHGRRSALKYAAQCEHYERALNKLAQVAAL